MAARHSARVRFIRSAAIPPQDGEPNGATTMLRSAIAAVLIYGYGHPGLEAARPAVLDRALQGFHRDINTIVSDAYRVITRFDEDRAVAAVRGYADHLETQLRKSD
jgi:hypothetical protein